MKKVLFALAAVVALAACSKEETIIADKGAAIGFDTFVENSTRSVDDKSLNNGNLATFGVFGTVTKAATALIFDNVAVTGSGVGNSASWAYDAAYTQYWIAGAKYNFAAVAPYNDKYDVQFSTTDFKTRLNFANNAETDLLYAQSAEITGLEGAVAGATTPANGKVAFTFRHILSKVKFSFENQYLSTGSTIRVRDIVLKNAHETASVTLDASTTDWTGHAGELPIEFGNAVSDTATAATALEAIAQDDELESYNVRFIIPGKEHTYTVSFEVDVLYGETVVETYKHTASLKFTPAAGTAYDIKTVISHTNIDPDQAQEPIQFTVTEVNEWSDYQDKDATID